MGRTARGILAVMAVAAAGALAVACDLMEGGGQPSAPDSGGDVIVPQPDVNVSDGPGDAPIEATPDAPPPAFVPSDLPGLALWLRADKGVVGADGGVAVLSWLDQSGSGHDVTAPSAPAWPTLEPSNATFGGMPTMRFQTGTQMLQAPASWHQAQPYSILFVASAVGQLYLFDSNDALNRASLLVVQPMSTVRLYTNSKGQQPSDGGPSISAPAVVVAVFAGPNSALYSNGVKVWSGDMGNDQNWGVTLGNTQTGGYPLQGSIAEVALWASALDATSVTKLDAYSKARYGFP